MGHTEWSRFNVFIIDSKYGADFFLSRSVRRIERESLVTQEYSEWSYFIYLYYAVYKF